MGKIVEEAKYYAIKVHEAVNHKYDGRPYEVHLTMVCEFVQTYKGLVSPMFLPTALAAAWTHDVIEDCRQTYNDVKGILGKPVADIVYALTNEKGKTRKERANDKYYDGIRKTPLATFVKICDRLANVSYSKEKGSKMLEAYKKEHAYFKDQLFSPRFIPMFLELEELLDIKK